MTDLQARFREDRWTAGVVGLGYVGLPLLVTAAEAGLDAVGFDISERLVTALSDGRSHVEDVTDAQLEKALAAGAVFTSDEAVLRHLPQVPSSRPTRPSCATPTPSSSPCRARSDATGNRTCRSSRRPPPPSAVSHVPAS